MDTKKFTVHQSSDGKSAEGSHACLIYVLRIFMKTLRWGGGV